jgi:myo-inositol-1(or 4)-monophosphatase
METSHAAESLDLAIYAAAVNAAESAGARLRAELGKTQRVERVSPHDLKLEIDRACEETILRTIFTFFPRHGALSEESGYKPPVEPFLWIVDPLDGTVNYFHDIPGFCTSVACYEVTRGPGVSWGHAGAVVSFPDGNVLGEPIVGVVYDPLARELYVGLRGKGASLNGRPLSMQPLSSLSETIVSLALNNRPWGIDLATRLLPLLLERARKVRSFGSTAMDIARVAAGRLGAFLQMGTNLWDFAAAAAILREAGGAVEAEEFLPGAWRILASNPGVFRELKELAAV